MPLCGMIARGPIAATLSMHLQGAPVDVRLRVKRGGEPARIMQPGAVRFDPGSGSNSFSFAFVAQLERRTGSTGLDFRPQWRSPTAETAVLRSASLRSSLRLAGPFDPRN